MAAQLLTLADVLKKPDAYSWDRALYLPKRDRWSLDAVGAVLDPMEAPTENDVPPFAVTNGLGYVLSVQQVQDVVAKARQQRADVSLNDLLRALQFYVERDSFIQF